MNRITLLLITALSLLSLDLVGQDRLKHIREEYYRINKITDLPTVKLSNHTYFLEDGKVVKSITTDTLGSYEFYYDFDNYEGNYKVMFMYLTPEDPTVPNARYYFEKSGYIFLYKENNKELSFSNANKALKKTPVKAYNAINIFINTFKESTDRYSAEKATIDSLFTAIENSQLKKINTESELYSEEDGQYFESGDIHYLNKEKELVKKENVTGGNHGTKKNLKYYHQGELILEMTESEYYINGFQYIVNKKYYTKTRRENIVFREEIYQNYDIKLKSTYGTNELLSFYIDIIEPEIKLN